MKIKDGFVIRKLQDEYYIVSVGSATKILNGTIQIDKVNAFVFDKIKESNNIDTICNLVLEKFKKENNEELTIEEVKKNSLKFIENLRQLGILVDD